MRKKTSAEELKKRRNKFIKSTPQGAKGRVKNRVEEPVKKRSTTKSGPTKAQQMAKANIKKYGGTAKAAAANKEAMRLKIKKKYLASKKKKK